MPLLEELRPLLRMNAAQLVRAKIWRRWIGQPKDNLRHNIVIEMDMCEIDSKYNELTVKISAEKALCKCKFKIQSTVDKKE